MSHPHAEPHAHEHGHAHADPARVLDAEHDVIRHLLHAVSGIADALEAGAPVPRKDVDDALDTMVGFADKCHHAKEEKILFPALRAASAEGEKLARELEGDHRAGRKLVATMRLESAPASEGDVASKRRLAQAARLYVKMLDRHIENEAQKLLPLVDLTFDEAERRRIAEAFERVEEEETGAGAHERYEGIVHRLSDAYAR